MQFCNKKILVKISGEFLGSPKSFENMQKFIDFITFLRKNDNKICIVVGGGNIIRGAQAANQKHRSINDQMGMLATIINGLAISTCLDDSTCLSAIEIPGICEKYSTTKAMDIWNSGKILIFTAGTGCSYFSTDTAAALRAIEMECDFMFKVTKVSGIYDKDPIAYHDAKFFKKISYDEVIKQDLKVMDLTAIALAKENALKICIFSIENLDYDKFTSGEWKYSIVY